MEHSTHPTYRFIRSQGDLDGACLLYALLNARQALTGTRVTTDAWSAAIRTLRNFECFLDNTRGSEETDGNPETERSRATKFINALAPAEPLYVRTVADLKDGKLGKLQPTDSDLLVCSNNQHWFCIVDSDETTAYAACSWVWQRDPQKYAERVSPEFERVFNDEIALGDLEFYKSRALVISTIEP